MGSTNYSKGDYNVICDRTGFKVKRSQCVLQWDNTLCLRSHAEARHPQDTLPPGRQSKPVRNARTERNDRYIRPGDVTADDL